MKNDEDVSVFVDFYGLPFLNSTSKWPIKQGVEVKPGELKFGIMTDKHPAIKLRFYTSESPSSGSFSCVIARWSI